MILLFFHSNYLGSRGVGEETGLSFAILNIKIAIFYISKLKNNNNKFKMEKFDNFVEVK